MKKVHFVGIGGIGLSALARYLKQEGYEITGSDIKATKITARLEEEGISVVIPHDPSCINDQELVVYSAVIKPDNVELVRAREKGIAIMSRSQALVFILKNRRVFSVCGAHGKSTTSAMLASLIEGSVVIGAESKQYGTNMYYKEGNNVIFEADESDESFLNSNPYVAVVTNAEPEHMEHYNYDLERFYGAYRRFLQSATIRVINAEDPFLATLEEMDAIRLYPSKDIQAIETTMHEGEPYTSFVLKDLGRFEVWGIGAHMALDASLAILASLVEEDVEIVREKLKRYKGIKKRFDIIAKEDNFALIDDYGHHPTEIKATLASAKTYANLTGLKTITAIWQPHKYSRTIDNLESFVQCFEGVDKLVILPVWKAGEKEVFIDFEKAFARYAPVFAPRVHRKDAAIEIFPNEEGYERFDEGVVISFGAGDITYQLRGVV
ncbi:UDP-N-acetylmuramate--L-alanine ligase [Sulfurospirillum cavolei]|uniref:UDP-N-acetylmuramate--L-alanine ligase n=1 Tax=Sulfurospirillum cavolei TaxID=366522 RepID=UPI000764AB82|nr:UDP-N-acetylmuramate--L-alanine ligase [Sulfurospirillum cavolei]